MKFKSKLLCLLLVFVMLLSVSAVAANENAIQSFKEVSTDPVSVSSQTSEVSSVSNSVENDEVLGVSNSVENDEVLSASNNNEILKAPDNGTFNALNDKIQSANDGDVIILENDYANTDNFNKNGISISKSLTIDGNGYAIDALQNGRVFQVTASNVILKNINFVNGNSSNGGAVYWNGADGTMNGCNFTFCSATGGYDSGGAVYWNGADGNVIDCSFVNCSSYYNGGAVYWIAKDGTLYNCSFVNCSSKEGGAGAVYWNNNAGTLYNCSFVNCSARSCAGAVFWYGHSGVLSNCSFVNCSSKISTDGVVWMNNGGGAVYWSGRSGVLGNCSFVNCSAAEYYYAHGGAVYWTGSSGVLGNCSFVNCSASPHGNGGAFGGPVFLVFWVIVVL